MLLVLTGATDRKGKVNSEEATSREPVGFKTADTPEFLILASDSARKEYIELETNMNVPLGAMRIAQDAWAKKIGGPVLKAYQQHTAAQDLAKETEDARMNKTVESLSPAAQAADRVIRGIYSNETLTKKQINTEVAKKMKKLSRKVYNELTLASQ
ncbi:hypothetical protein Y032_0050g1926 [Ancylostoma ceylanicum]|nr:hypothetical protein Y032_0050g1926 [Ancylostoma ceylanicum]